MSRYYSIYEGAILLLLSIIAFAYSFQFERETIYKYGVTGWPRAVIIAIGILAILRLMSGLYNLYKTRDISETHGTKITGLIFSNLHQKGKQFVIMFFPLAWIYLSTKIGFYLVTPIFVASYMYILGSRRIITISVITISVYLAIMFLFIGFLYVPLPLGKGVFYDINIKIISFFL